MDGQGPVTDYEKLAAHEFYYDGPRQRYLVREVDPDTWEPTNDPQLWTDYHGQPPYGDFELTFDQGDPVTGETMRYLAGSGIQAQQTLAGGQPDETSYLHGDLIASTMLTTDEGGTPVSAVSYTAFGELITDNCELTTRYQYAGVWGYESGLLTLDGADGTAPITLQHVGWRWYQPDTGRFVQRDPVGIMGGLNVYVYCRNNPLVWADPDGLMPPPDPSLVKEKQLINKIVNELEKRFGRRVALALKPLIIRLIKAGMSPARIRWIINRYPLDLVKSIIQKMVETFSGTGTLCIFLALPVIGGYAGAIAGELVRPVLDPLSRGAGAWGHGVEGADDLFAGNL